MMIASVVLEMFLAILWFCAPPEKARFLEVLLPMPMAFLFGKFTNGFGRKGSGNGQPPAESGWEEEASPSSPPPPSPNHPAPDTQNPSRTTLRAGLLCFGMLLTGGCAALWSGSRGLPSPPPPGPADRAPQQFVTVTTTSDRDDEAARFITDYVREPFLVHTPITIAAPTLNEFRSIFVGRGNSASALSGHTWGYFLTLRPDLGQSPTLYVIRDQGGDARERLFRVLHEWGHVVWHYLLTAQEWTQWNTTWSGEYSDLTGPEGFANTIADWCIGKRRKGHAGRLFEQICESIRQRAGALQRE
jgi:hypothetical protein